MTQYLNLDDIHNIEFIISALHSDFVICGEMFTVVYHIMTYDDQQLYLDDIHDIRH